MRFIFCLFFVLGFVANDVRAQNAPIYNSTTSNSGSQQQKRPIYNSSKNSSSRNSSSRPLSIRNMLSDSQQSASSSRASRNGQNPYRFNSSYNGRSAASLTPAQIRAKQASDRQRAQDRVQAAREQRQSRQAALEKQNNVGGKTNRSKQNFQEEEKTTRTRKRRSTYTTKGDTPFVPVPVFNRVN